VRSRPALVGIADFRESPGLDVHVRGRLLAAVPVVGGGVIGPGSDCVGTSARDRCRVVGGRAIFASTVQGFAGLFVAFFLLAVFGSGIVGLWLSSNRRRDVVFANRICRMYGRSSASAPLAVVSLGVPQWLSDIDRAYRWRMGTYQVVAAICVSGLAHRRSCCCYRDRSGRRWAASPTETSWTRVNSTKTTKRFQWIRSDQWREINQSRRFLSHSVKPSRSVTFTLSVR